MGLEPTGLAQVGLEPATVQVLYQLSHQDSPARQAKSLFLQGQGCLSPDEQGNS